MSPRPSIAMQLTNTAGAISTWIAEHRAELVAAVQQADSERGARLLMQLCESFPLAAGAIRLALGGSAVSALAAIATFDQNLAAELEKQLPNFEKLQNYWRAGKS